MLYLKRIDPVHPGAPLLIEKLHGSGKGSQGNDNNVDISWLFSNFLEAGTFLGTYKE